MSAIAGRGAKRAAGRPGFVPVRGPATGKLLALYNPELDLLEVDVRGVKELINLSRYRTQNNPLDSKPKTVLE